MEAGAWGVKRGKSNSLCLSGWAEGLQSLAGVLLLTAAAASALYLKVVPSLRTTPSISSSFQSEGTINYCQQ